MRKKPFENFNFSITGNQNKNQLKGKCYKMSKIQTTKIQCYMIKKHFQLVIKIDINETKGSKN